jgi:uncharacterized protein YecE (DUF72 family)
MGYYLETPENFNKANFLCEEYNGQIISVEEAESLVNDPDSVAVVCVVNNGFFEAAAYCYNAKEFEAFTIPEDARPKTWISFNNVYDIRQAANY